jgi:hypothetical protein
MMSKKPAPHAARRDIGGGNSLADTGDAAPQRPAAQLELVGPDGQIYVRHSGDR